tara:strand:+ start:4135 stop:4923 length:789 start_codon:yes stop_codon:yes gene_type:complete
MVNFLKLSASYILTVLETILFKNINAQVNIDKHSIYKNGWKKISNNYCNIFPLDYEQIKYHSPYSSLIILNKETIDKLIEEIFTKSNILSEIENETKMKYCIDFFLYWETRNIPEDKINDQYFANLWHRDNLFSKNVIKLFILSHDTDENNGPITWIDKEESIKFEKNINSFSKDQKYLIKQNTLIGDKGDACLINPNTCLHKAGNPKSGHKRQMIMFQLNPSNEFGYRNDLYGKQFFLEPNLPLIRNIGRKKTKIKIQKHT